MTNDTSFRTKDLYEGAFLYSQDCKLIELLREGNTIWFSFEDKEKCSRLLKGFWSKEAHVTAKDYADSIRSFKGLIFSQK